MSILIIEQTPPAKCEMCGAFEELRPYGPNNENICFECGMKDEATSTKKFSERLAKGDDLLADLREVLGQNNITTT